MPKQDVILKTDNQLSDRSPSISLSLTISGAEPAIIDPLVPHVDEIVIVSTITEAQLLDRWKRHLDHVESSKTVVLIEASPSRYPHLYRLDASETFNVGSPLCNEPYPGQTTGLPFVADRSALRNLSWTRCTQEWRLALLDHEQLFRPDLLRHLGQTLDLHLRDVAFGVQTRYRRAAYTGIFAQNSPEILFEGVARESIEHGTRPSIIEGSLATCSCHDDDLESFRCLYAEARRTGWDAVAPVDLLHLAQIGISLKMHEFAENAIKLYLDQSLYPEERSWAYSLRGELLEKLGKLGEAAQAYEEASREYPSWKASLRLCRTCFQLGRWEDCLSAYNRAVSQLDHHSLCDNYSADPAWSIIFVAQSLKQMGQEEDARHACQILRRSFPESEKIKRFCNSLGY